MDEGEQQGRTEQFAEVVAAAIAFAAAGRFESAETAEQCLRRALALVDDDADNYARRVQLTRSLWDVQWWQARYSEAQVTAEALLALAEARQDLPLQAAAWNRIAAAQNRQGAFPAALRSVQRAERLARRSAAAREVVLALFNRGLTLNRLGGCTGASQTDQPTPAVKPAAGMLAAPSDLTQAQAARRLAARPIASQGSAARSLSTGPVLGGEAPQIVERETGRILTLLGLIHQRAGRCQQAESDYLRVLDTHRRWNDSRGQVTALYHLGANACKQGDFQSAAGYCLEALGLIRELGFHELDLACQVILAAAQVELGKHAQAVPRLRAVLLRAKPGWALLPEALRCYAQACLGLERWDEALEAALRALQSASASQQAPGLAGSEQVGRAWRTLGRVAASFRGQVLVEGRPCTAHSCYAASLQVFVEIGEAGEQARTAREWASYELEHGDRGEGARLWQETRELFARLDMPTEAGRMDCQVRLT